MRCANGVGGKTTFTIELLEERRLPVGCDSHGGCPDAQRPPEARLPPKPVITPALPGLPSRWSTKASPRLRRPLSLDRLLPLM